MKRRELLMIVGLPFVLCNLAIAQMTPELRQVETINQRVSQLEREGKPEDALHENERLFSTLEKKVQETHDRRLFAELVRVAGTQCQLIDSVTASAHSNTPDALRSLHRQNALSLEKLAQRMNAIVKAMGNDSRALEFSLHIAHSSVMEALRANDPNVLKDCLDQAERMTSDPSLADNSKANELSFTWKLIGCYLNTMNKGLAAFQTEAASLIDGHKDAPWVCADAMSMVHLIPEFGSSLANLQVYEYYALLEKHLSENRSDPTLEELYLKLGDTAGYLGLSSEACRWYEKFIAMHPKDDGERKYAQLELSRYQKEDSELMNGLAVVPSSDSRAFEHVKSGVSKASAGVIGRKSVKAASRNATLREKEIGGSWPKSLVVICLFLLAAALLGAYAYHSYKRQPQ